MDMHGSATWIATNGNAAWTFSMDVQLGYATRTFSIDMQL
jgi:hypothetical protein